MKFQPHLSLAHNYWASHIKKGCIAIDATCGNGHDSLFLARQVCNEMISGKLYCFDIQEVAIESTCKRLHEHLPPSIWKRVAAYRRSHEKLPFSNNFADLIVYNLGYLPGGNKTITTEVRSTLLSLNEALRVARPGGLISVTCYPGHPEGLKETQEIIKFISNLSSNSYTACHHQWPNRPSSPQLIIINK